MEAKKKRMQELVELLNRARRAYEQEDTEIMSNYEYDRLYDELEGLERELGTTLASSPTVNVGYEVLSELPKERHEKPMLSLDKTKDVEQLKSFLGEQKAVISWKMDGLTIVLTYQNGRLQKAVTRGNGDFVQLILPIHNHPAPDTKLNQYLCQWFHKILVIHTEKLHRRCPRIGKRAEDVEHRTESQLLADCSHMFH